MDEPATPRRHSPAAERNRGPILQVLQRVLPDRGRALELASGTGQHAAHFVPGLPGWTWQPSDPEPSALASIQAWAADLASPRLLAPLPLDVMAETWPVQGPYDAFFCANMLHIAPWPTCAALMRGAAHHAARDAVLALYGPFFVQGEPASPGNLDFDEDLRRRDARWGLRLLHEVQAQALAAGWHLHERVAMPANNLTLVLRRSPP